ncbi:hypothetical protein FB645_003825 [Coemansia sp. IMI 203386]|nr:hypothetical protein FB645_003825 [Coemansia sp. IMI 203386]
MNSDYRTAARVLCTSTSPNVIAEVTRDTLERCLSPAPETAQTMAMIRLGQYMVGYRIIASRTKTELQDQYLKQTRNPIDNLAYLVTSGLQAMVRPPLVTLEANDQMAVNSVLTAARDAAAKSGTAAAAAAAAVAALGLIGGVVAALQEAKIKNTVVEKAADLFATVAKTMVDTHAEHVIVSAIAAAAAFVDGPVMRRLAAIPEVSDGLIRLLFVDSPSDMVVDIHMAVDLVARLLTAPQSNFHSALNAMEQVHMAAVDWMIAAENNRRPTDQSQQQQQLVLVVVDRLLQRYCISDAYLNIPVNDLIRLWVLIVDTMALVHHCTLKAGRSGTEVFRSASTLAINFSSLVQHSWQVDLMVQKLFALQKCLCFLPSTNVNSITVERSFAVLFYLDLFEHLVGYLQPNTLRQMVLPLACLYAGRQGLAVGADWFESAHAVILAVLENTNESNTETAIELVPWYSDLILSLYPDHGMSGDLLRIAYSASINAISTQTEHTYLLLADEYVKDRIARLQHRVDQAGITPNMSSVAKEIAIVRERELLLVLVDQLATVPVSLLPALLVDISNRLTSEKIPVATRASVINDIEQIVLVKTDIARKPSLSKWLWQLRQTLLSTGVFSKL